MEQKYAAPIDDVYALLTDASWLEARCLAMGELAAKVKAKKTAKGATLSMARCVKRDLPSLVAKVLSPEAELQFEETWTKDGEGYVGKLSMDIQGQPVTMTADFSLQPAGKGCVYRIQHVARCGIPLIGGPIAKYAQGEIEQGCAREFAYLVKHLKAAR